MSLYEKAFATVIDEINRADSSAGLRIAWGGSNPEHIAKLVELSTSLVPGESARLEAGPMAFELLCFKDPLGDVPQFMLWRSIDPIWVLSIGDAHALCGQLVRASLLGRAILQEGPGYVGICGLAAMLPLCVLSPESLLLSVDQADRAHVFGSAKARGEV